MFNFLIVLFFGWPAILATMILAAIGLWKRNYHLIITASILAFPFSWFISGFPIIRSPAFLLPVILLASAFAMYRKHEMLAWIIAVPFFLAVMLLFYVISAGTL